MSASFRSPVRALPTARAVSAQLPGHTGVLEGDGTGSPEGKRCLAGAGGGFQRYCEGLLALGKIPGWVTVLALLTEVLQF